MTKNLTHREMVIAKLKTGWFTGFQMCIEINSSQALARICELKKKPHIGWKLEERQKDCETRCQEYRLVVDPTTVIELPKGVESQQSSLFETRGFTNGLLQ